ncbi:hypothetical protein GCM10009534_66150 [Kribbella sandramycini]
MLTIAATYQTGFPSASIVTIIVVVAFILTLSFGRSYPYVGSEPPKSTLRQDISGGWVKRSAPVDDRGACPCESRGEWDLHTLGGT